VRRHVALVLLLVGGIGACKGKRRAAAPPSEDAAVEAEEGDAEAGEAIDLLDAAALTVELERVSGPTVTQTYIDLRNWISELTLVVTNGSDAPIRATLPSYLFAHLPDYVYPYGDEGCLPPVQLVVAMPADEIEIPPGDTFRLHVPEAWFLGNAMRPFPARASGPSRFAVEAAPEDHPHVRLAEVVRDAPEAGLAFAFAGGCTPDAWLERAPVRRLVEAERALRDAGIEPRSPVFDAARARRAATVTTLTDELTTYEHQRTLEGLTIRDLASDPAFSDAWAGDAEIAALVARFLQTDATGARPAIIVGLLERLGVASPTVLGALEHTAREDLEPATRDQAAAAHTKLSAGTP
jgi:hypothetical protein